MKHKVKRIHFVGIGGSLGAKALNDVMPRALALLPGERRPLVTHQSGTQHVESLRQAYSAAGVQAATPAFIGDMAAAYAEAGRFKEAVATGEKALQLASAVGGKELSSQIEHRLQFYLEEKPYHEGNDNHE